MPDDRYAPSERFEIPQAIAVPGMMIRASYGLGGDNRVLQFELAVDRDEDESEILRRSEMMTRVGDQLRARFELPGLRRQLKNIQTRHQENQARRQGVDAELTFFKERRLAEVRQLEAEHKDVFNRAYDAHVASGRQASFTPQGAVKSKLAAIQADMERQTGPVDRREQDLLAQLATLDNEIAEGERAVSQLTELLGEAERLARGEDISGV